MVSLVGSLLRSVNCFPSAPLSSTIAARSSQTPLNQVPRFIVKTSNLADLSHYKHKVVRIQQDPSLSESSVPLDVLMSAIKTSKAKVHELWLFDVDNTRQGIGALSEEISRSKHLSILKLGGFPQSEEEALMLSKGLSQNKSLENVSLQDVKAEEKGINAILEAFLKIQPLKSIHLSNCEIGLS